MYLIHYFMAQKSSKDDLGLVQLNLDLVLDICLSDCRLVQVKVVFFSEEISTAGNISEPRFLPNQSTAAMLLGNHTSVSPSLQSARRKSIRPNLVLWPTSFL